MSLVKVGAVTIGRVWEENGRWVATRVGEGKFVRVGEGKTQSQAISLIAQSLIANSIHPPLPARFRSKLEQVMVALRAAGMDEVANAIIDAMRSE